MPKIENENQFDFIELLIQDIRAQLLFEKKITGETLQKVASEEFSLALTIGFTDSIIESLNIENSSIYGYLLVDKLNSIDSYHKKLELISDVAKTDPLLQNTISQAIISYYLIECIRFGIIPDRIYVSGLAILTSNQY